jgi:NADH-quinone oxidoreductase subunit E
MLTSEGLEEIEATRAEEPSARHALLTALRVTQRERHKVGPEEIEYIAGLLGLSPAIVEGVARFYDQITASPTGQHIVRVCGGITCYLSQSDRVAQDLKGFLGIADGEETSPDGEFTVRLVECIGDCDHAPAGMLDDRFVGPLDERALRTISER